MHYVYQPHIRTFFWKQPAYYRANKDEILAWAELYKCEVQSLKHGWITCPDDNVVTLFMLRWT